ncbi:hypothetical protein D915_009324 [Fasciola hepatica]|uniref:Apple domain-containing protein n=1 Tax=Fasciola hepatica TaxID=6192 RepID=A0A4E0R064_FASHE|nr:hypothetical protein D915_009324 [Fasciola hepatica]
MFLASVDWAVSKIIFMHLFIAERLLASCPMGLNDYGSGVCGLFITSVKNYCDAHQACRDAGIRLGLRLVLTGTNVSKFIAASNRPSMMFTSINTLLTRKDNWYAGWRIGVPGYSSYATPADPSMPWGEDQPNHLSELLVLIKGKQINDDIQLSTTVASACKWVGATSTLQTDPRPELFDSRFPETLSNFFFPDFWATGCFDQQQTSTILSCVKICKQNFDCRSFYYNNEAQKCMIALYVDSRLPLDMKCLPGKWHRYGHPNW